MNKNIQMFTFIVDIFVENDIYLRLIHFSVTLQPGSRECGTRV